MRPIIALILALLPLTLTAPVVKENPPTPIFGSSYRTQRDEYGNIIDYGDEIITRSEDPDHLKRAYPPSNENPQENGPLDDTQERVLVQESQLELSEALNPEPLPEPATKTKRSKLCLFIFHCEDENWETEIDEEIREAEAREAEANA